MIPVTTAYTGCGLICTHKQLVGWRRWSTYSATQEPGTFVELTHHRWVGLCESVRAEPTLGPVVPYTWHEVCGATVDYLVRLRMFLDHTVARASPERLAEFKRAAAAEYDMYVEYRLVALRHDHG